MWKKDAILGCLLYVRINKKDCAALFNYFILIYIYFFVHKFNK